jgi:hypothetical protein
LTDTGSSSGRDCCHGRLHAEIWTTSSRLGDIDGREVVAELTEQEYGDILEMMQLAARVANKDSVTGALNMRF